MLTMMYLLAAATTIYFGTHSLLRGFDRHGKHRLRWSKIKNDPDFATSVSEVKTVEFVFKKIIITAHVSHSFIS